VFFETVKKSADRLIRLVNNVLDYERVEMGAFEMTFRDVNLKMACHEVVTGFIPLAEERNVAIRLKAQEIMAWVDEDRFKQVLTNLLSNALSFSPAGTAIEVSLERRDDMVHGAVEDAGSGISRQERAMIFKQFYTKNVSGGTGLGLAICKGIIEAHRGVIGVTDSDLGGSRFWFMMPLRQKAEPPDEKTSAGR
jgi:signal transduction histidine kinase